jgi:hypothetical protein
VVELDDDLCCVDVECLAGTQGERDTRPPGVVHVDGQGGVRLGVATGVDSGFVDV